jgi:hypothetical protein
MVSTPPSLEEFGATLREAFAFLERRSFRKTAAPVHWRRDLCRRHPRFSCREARSKTWMAGHNGRRAAGCASVERRPVDLTVERDDGGQVPPVPTAQRTARARPRGDRGNGRTAGRSGHRRLDHAGES